MNIYFDNIVKIYLFNETGTEVLRMERPNLVVNTGLNLIRDYLNQSLADPMKYISVGDDGTAAEASQTELLNELFRDEITKRTPEDRKVTFELLLGTTQQNGETLREAGLFSAAGSMFARVTHEAINKTSIIQVLYSWTIFIAVAP